MATPKVPTPQQAADKWGNVTPGRSQYYQEGASNAGADWESKATAASGAFKAGISAGNIEQMFKGGIKRAGAEKYNRKVTTVGVSRFGPGVIAAKGDYQSGIAPMLDVIAKTDLGVRQPRGSEANIERVRKLATALNKARMAQRAAGM